MFDLFLPQTPLRTLRLGESIFVFFLSQRRRVRGEFQCFVLTPNTFACFAPWRDFIYFSLAKAPRSPRTSMFELFLPQTPLRTLRPGEIYLFLSLAEAQRPQRISMFI